jgi:hypothetical protein
MAARRQVVGVEKVPTPLWLQCQEDDIVIGKFVIGRKRMNSRWMVVLIVKFIVEGSSISAFDKSIDFVGKQISSSFGIQVINRMPCNFKSQWVVD